MNDPFEGVNWSEVRAEIAERAARLTIAAGDQVAVDGHWPYLDRAPQSGTVTRIYERRSRYTGKTPMARVHWQDGSYSAIQAGRLVRVRTVGSFDNMEFDRNMPLIFTTVPATDEPDDEPTENDEAADYSWTHDR